MTLEEFIAQRGPEHFSADERAALERMTTDERELWLQLRNGRDEWLALAGPAERYEVFAASFGLDTSSVGTTRRKGRG